ncbi:MAG: class I SAM-dependent methyltransferase [Arenicella sp.]
MINLKGAKFTVPAAINTQLFGEVGFGDEYMKGNIMIEGDLSEFIESNGKSVKRRVPYLPTTSRRVAKHYNIPARFYELLLGESMAYTCGNFYGDKSLPLKHGQHNKYRAHAQWLDMGRCKDAVMLDCGCGWGGFSRFVSGNYLNMLIDGLSLSEEQIKYAIKMGSDAENISYHLSRWEQFKPGYKYDRFTAIGMLEHVGQKNLVPFFNWVNSVLEDRAIGTLQFISRDKPMSKWFDKHIFPTAYTPTYNEVVRVMTGAGLQVTDTVERGQDYAITLKHWLDNFESSLGEIRAMGFDETFIRMFRLYLCGGIASFRSGNSQLIQLRFVKN